jgi:hypothetical protein
LGHSHCLPGLRGKWLATTNLLLINALAKLINFLSVVFSQVNSLPASRQPALGLTGSMGTGLWVASFLFEVSVHPSVSRKVVLIYV